MTPLQAAIAKLSAPGTRTALGAGVGALTGGVTGYMGSDPYRRPSKRFLSALSGAAAGGAGGAALGLSAPLLARLAGSKKLGDRISSYGRIGSKLKKKEDLIGQRGYAKAKNALNEAIRSYNKSPASKGKLHLRDYAKGGLAGLGAMSALTGGSYVSSRLADEIMKY
jgi:hypothetical protein